MRRHWHFGCAFGLSLIGDTIANSWWAGGGAAEKKGFLVLIFMFLIWISLQLTYSASALCMVREVAHRVQCRVSFSQE